MKRNRTIALIVVVIICGGISFVGTRLAAIDAQKAGRNQSVSWLGEAAPSVIKLRRKI